jgi:hypothetical protein
MTDYSRLTRHPYGTLNESVSGFRSVHRQVLRIRILNLLLRMLAMIHDAVATY